MEMESESTLLPEDDDDLTDDEDLLDLATLLGDVRLPRHDHLTYRDLLDIIEEKVLSKVDWDDHWPDQIDGKKILGYRLQCDYSCQDFEGGCYITTVWDGDVPLFDIMAGGGHNNHCYVRSVEERKLEEKRRLYRGY